ncbi:glycoside hydrolase family 43 protein [Negadavirga shengliensis]|uniref:Glycoside hydrolase family 43 protein n=1 Tax=Negadavirga shengliensis TaxID=1389218 RepID=A0ABV9T0V1_9BACT
MTYKSYMVFFLKSLLITAVAIVHTGVKGQAPELGNKSADTHSIFLADPAIFAYEGVYYLYGTSGHDPDQGFEVFISDDLQSWKSPEEAQNGYALRKEDVFGDKGFWAPQVFYYQKKFYMAYTANEQIAIAIADSPLGPFKQEEKIALSAPVKQIDPYIFMDEDGKKYLYHVRLTEGNRLFVAEMEDDLSAIIPETLRECITAEEDWENTQNVPWPVAEGPSVIKHKGLYYFVYSANDFRNPDYAVGYAVGETPYGPWKKHPDNPILSRKDVLQNGSGHGDFFQDDNGEYYYVFHTHYSDGQVRPRRTAVVKAKFEASAAEDLLKMDKESVEFLQKID